MFSMFYSEYNIGLCDLKSIFDLKVFLEVKFKKHVPTFPLFGLYF